MTTTHTLTGNKDQDFESLLLLSDNKLSKLELSEKSPYNLINTGDFWERRCVFIYGGDIAHDKDNHEISKNKTWKQWYYFLNKIRETMSMNNFVKYYYKILMSLPMVESADGYIISIEDWYSANLDVGVFTGTDDELNKIFEEEGGPPDMFINVYINKSRLKFHIKGLFEMEKIYNEKYTRKVNSPWQTLIDTLERKRDHFEWSDSDSDSSSMNNRLCVGDDYISFDTEYINYDNDSEEFRIAFTKLIKMARDKIIHAHELHLKFQRNN